MGCKHCFCIKETQKLGTCVPHLIFKSSMNTIIKSHRQLQYNRFCSLFPITLNGSSQFKFLQTFFVPSLALKCFFYIILWSYFYSLRNVAEKIPFESIFLLNPHQWRCVLSRGWIKQNKTFLFWTFRFNESVCLLKRKIHLYYVLISFHQ